MKNLKTYLGIGAFITAILFFIAADHIDAPAVAGGESDITDFYAFQGENTDNIVFVANLQGLLSPSATQEAQFDENIMIEFNIDTNGDAIEDLVIQAAPKNKRMYFLGPIVPNQTGLVSTPNSDSNEEVNSVKITNYDQTPRIESSLNGIKYFAGPRDDPFFFDFAQYSAILAGNADGFLEEGVDTFAGTNVLSVVIEVPKSLLGNSNSINTWVETKRKQ
ncbi:DUF4331 family protein [Flavisericum labens]|uniref:DUF4331 family protein n=1 Tax=Flavisericum labens TaxID=3377112 RepID=UPI00387A907D